MPGMCGRYSLTTPIEGLRRLFGFDALPNLPARHNIAPTQAVLAVRADGEGGREAFMARWGLIPGWAKDPAIASKMINARAETVSEKPAYRTAFRKRRCLVPADSFYEWIGTSSPKQPYRIHFEDGAPFAFAGLWERWQGGDGSDVETMTIVTTEAAPEIAPLHHRMPVILDPENFRSWLTADAGTVAPLMRPYDGARTIVHHPVSKRVNNVRNDDASLLDAIDLEEITAEDPPAAPKRTQLDLF